MNIHEIIGLALGVFCLSFTAGLLIGAWWENWRWKKEYNEYIDQMGEEMTDYEPKVKRWEL